jgi:hypothetical protein
MVDREGTEMSAYAPASSVGWLDFDAAASERVGTMMRALEEPGTLDAIGLGSVRDLFSAMLSPGTSTIQTRLRYFIFLPWIFTRLEAERIAPAGYASRLRSDEARLIDCLRHLGPNNGVVGFSAGIKVKRMPSEAYWGGLRSWGLARLSYSLAEYAQRASALGRLQHEHDDDGSTTERVISMWAQVPEAPKDFLQANLTFDLELSEAELLADLIRSRHPGTLLAVMCGNPSAAAAAEFPWEVPDAGLPANLVDLLRHARCFSEVTVGPQHVYNVMLAQKARRELGWDTSELESSERLKLDDWVDVMADRHDELRAWADDLPTFWALLSGNAVSDLTRSFIESVVPRAMANPAGLVDDPVMGGLVRDREIRLKGKRARLAHRSALENWNQVPFGGQLNYRWPITKGYLADLAAGLELVT